MIWEVGSDYLALFKMKKLVKPKHQKLINKLTNEEVFSVNYDQTKIIDGVEYVTIYHPKTPTRTHLMRKDALVKA